MSHTVSIRLGVDLANWLERAAKKAGIPKGRIIREQLEAARAADGDRPYLRLAGSIRGERDLSRRRGFSRR